jgi:hypothetical protein
MKHAGIKREFIEVNAYPLNHIAMKTLSMILFSLMLSLHVSYPQGVTTHSGNRIFFDDAAARYVLAHPERALVKEHDSIWNAFEGYRITLLWHKESNFPVTWEIWERGLNRFLHKDTSLIRKSLELAGSLQAKAKKEKDRIIAHISSFLGKKTSFDAYVYFVAFTIPYAFCVDTNKIGIDLTADEWGFDTDCILNMLIHEIYHVGFKLNSPDYKYTEQNPADNKTFSRFNYAYLQSEGMATYVGYKALNLYPSDYRHEDYQLLENDDKVQLAIDHMNRLVKMCLTEPVDTLAKASWDIGVEQRAYYIAGAYMAKIIEEKYGTERLAELVGKGSLEFVREYNGLVPDNRKIEIE